MDEHVATQADLNRLSLALNRDARTTLRVSCSARQGIRVAFRLLFDSLTALIRRTTVEFEVRDDS